MGDQCRKIGQCDPRVMIYIKFLACGGPKKSPHTSSIVQIKFSFWSFEISECVLRNLKITFGFDSFSNQCLIYLDPLEYTIH